MHNVIYASNTTTNNTSSGSSLSSTDEDFDDWLHRHHFDGNLLIEDGLAIEAPDGMYEIKENMYDIKYNWNERQ